MTVDARLLNLGSASGIILTAMIYRMVRDATKSRLTEAFYREYVVPAITPVRKVIDPTLLLSGVLYYIFMLCTCLLDNTTFVIC